VAHRHKRDTDARPTPDQPHGSRPRRKLPRASKLAGPIARIATPSVVGTGVAFSEPSTREVIASSSGSSISAAGDSGDVERITMSRSTSSRADYEKELDAYQAQQTREATQRAIERADTRLWTTAPLNLWTAADASADKTGVVDAGTKVLVTGRKALGRTELVVHGKARWVTSGYLSEDKPEAEKAGGAGVPDLGGTCTNGTSVPSGVSPNIVAVHEAVCASFPEITTYGTFRGDGEHAQGLAVDIMVSGDRGWQVAEFVRAHYDELGVSYVIYSQHIWSVERASEGWRLLEDRGSVTANHYDHVHVTTY
jgi:hypothetical protein